MLLPTHSPNYGFKTIDMALRGGGTFQNNGSVYCWETDFSKNTHLFTVASCMQAPWYNSNTAHQGEVDDMRDDLEPILYQHGVDIVFAGTLCLTHQYQ